MCIDLYGDIRQQMEQWKTKKDIEKQNIIQKEIDSIFHLLSEFGRLEKIINFYLF